MIARPRAPPRAAGRPPRTCRRPRPPPPRGARGPPRARRRSARRRSRAGSCSLMYSPAAMLKMPPSAVASRRRGRSTVGRRAGDEVDDGDRADQAVLRAEDRLADLAEQRRLAPLVGQVRREEVTVELARRHAGAASSSASERRGPFVHEPMLAEGRRWRNDRQWRVPARSPAGLAPGYPSTGGTRREHPGEVPGQEHERTDLERVGKRQRPVRSASTAPTQDERADDHQAGGAAEVPVPALCASQPTRAAATMTDR